MASDMEQPSSATCTPFSLPMVRSRGWLHNSARSSCRTCWPPGLLAPSPGPAQLFCTSWFV
eukprot:759164-Pleurochrysis_carterae.AAC.1